MRIIAGQWRGRQIRVPACAQTRPYPDRVRQAVFDALGSFLGSRPGSIPPIAVLDLYAGSGAMGLEALSRGAAYCTFVEQDARAAGELRKNVEQLGAGERSHVIVGDASRVHPAVTAAGPIRLVLIDPPYAVSAAGDRRGSVPALMQHLASLDAIARDAVLLLRHPVDVGYDAGMLAGYTVHSARSFGGMTVTWLRFADQHEAPAGGAN